MRILLVSSLAIAIAVALWVLNAQGPSPSTVVRDVSDVGEARASDAALAEPDVALVTDGENPASVRTELELSPAKSTAPGVPWPKGFARLNLSVMAGGQPIPATLVTVESSDVVFDTDEASIVGGDPPAARTNADGNLSAYVRPTRSITIRAIEEKTGVSSTGTYTSPFEGKERSIEIQLAGTHNESNRILQFVSELDGQAIADQRVVLTEDSKVGVLEVDTDVKGVAEVPSGIPWSYRIEAEGFVPRSGLLSATAPPGGLATIKLRPFARLHGRIHPSLEALRRQAAAGTKVNTLGYIELTLESAGQTSWTVRGNTRGLLRSSREVGQVDGNGEWAISDVIVPDSKKSIPRLYVWFRHGAFRRRLATLTDVCPGDNIQVSDPWDAAEPWQIRFSLADQNRDILPDRVCFTHVDYPEFPVNIEIRRGRGVSLPVAPLGKWSYRLSAIGCDESAALTGTVTNDGSGSATVELADAGSVSGTFTIPGTKKGKAFSVAVVPSGGALPDERRTRSFRSLVVGSEFRLPAMPAARSFDLVVYSENWAHRSQPHDGYFEHARVPIMAGDHNVRIVGKPYSETDD